MRSMTEGAEAQPSGRVPSPSVASGATSPWRGRIASHATPATSSNGSLRRVSRISTAVTSATAQTSVTYQ